MEFIRKRRIPRSTTMWRGFSGYCPQLWITKTQWFHEENLSSRAFPLLCPREPRRRLSYSPVSALGKLNGLVVLEGNVLKYGDRTCALPLSTGEKQLLTFGAYIIVLPDLLWVNTLDGSYDFCEKQREFEIPLGIQWCDQEGNPLEGVVDGTSAPGNTEQYWLDLTPAIPVLKVYGKELGKWIPMDKTFVRLSGERIGEDFPQGSRILVDACPDLAPIVGTGLCTVYHSGRDFLVLEGAIPTLRLETGVLQFRLIAPIPLMDYMIVHENRLWGCRYGLDLDGNFVNEIYASALGDFTSWYRFRGIASDSYTLSLGSEGPFTGAAVVGGYPVFFKEQCLHKIYGNTPSSYRVVELNCMGVASGSHKSMAMLEDALMYLGRDGFYLYDGSLPVKVSGDLEGKTYKDGIGGVLGQVYYGSVFEEDGTSVILTYDMGNRVWHRETGVRPLEFVGVQGVLYYRTEAPGLFAIGTKEGEPAEGTVSWEAVTGILREDRPQEGFFTGLRIRLTMEPSSDLMVFAQYDSCGTFTPLGAVGYGKAGSREVTFPIRRCDHLRLKLRGRGNAMIHSMTFTMEG